MSSEICKETSVDHTKNDYSHIYSGQLNQREQISVSNTCYYYINTYREILNVSFGLSIQNIYVQKRNKGKAQPMFLPLSLSLSLSLCVQNTTFSLFLLPFPFSYQKSWNFIPLVFWKDVTESDLYIQPYLGNICLNKLYALIHGDKLIIYLSQETHNISIRQPSRRGRI